MIPVLGYKDQTVAVLGLGRSGLATARALQAGGAKTICWDDGDAARAVAEGEGFICMDPVRFGLDKIALLVTSPGIPHLYPAPHPVIAAAMAAGVPIDNDVSLFFRSFATQEWDSFEHMPRVVTVTGSNGKSTTSALIHHLLLEADRPTQLGGNIGRGVLDLEPAQDGEVTVLELSSYQTELARNLTPDFAVFTNLSADHLERHGGVGGYFAAKARLFTAGSPDRAIIGVDETEGMALANTIAESAGDDQVIRVSTTNKLSSFNWSVTARKGFLAETRKGRQVGSIDLRGIDGLPGQHNHQNACCAYAIMRCLHIAPKVIEAGLKSFGGLPHRSQKIAEKDGVIFVNDSKATNVDAALQSLRAYKNIRWICGGQQKEGGLGGLAEAWESVEHAYVIGEQADDFASGLNVPFTECGTMDKAVAQAIADAKSGDVILLAPAAASWDQYTSFEARGDHFAQLVQAAIAD